MWREWHSFRRQRVKLVIFGLTISSSWGNGHATLWRGLLRALARSGWRVVFFEKDVPYYAQHRDTWQLPGVELVLYPDWDSVRTRAQAELRGADVGMVTSYCPDGIAATDLLLDSPTNLRVFYDLDTPVTLGELRRGKPLSYIGPGGLAGFDLVLSYTGGAALEALQSELGARRTAPLYGSVDPRVHHPVAPVDRFRADLSYLGTYAEDRQAKLERLFLQPARQLSDRRFLIGGALYPARFPWSENVGFAQHTPPHQHPAFFSSSRLTLNITRQAMASMGYCPSGRLFEAAASAAPVLSDWWEGLDAFYEPQREILIADSSDQAIAAIERSDAELRRIAEAARQRTLEQYTAAHRAGELESLLQQTLSQRTAEQPMVADRPMTPTLGR